MVYRVDRHRHFQSVYVGHRHFIKCRWPPLLPTRPHFSIDFTPSWITQQISVEKCAHRGASARRERQTMFKIVTWTKHHITASPTTRTPVKSEFSKPTADK